MTESPKRKKHMQARGIERRNLLVQAALDLLSKHDVDDVTFLDIARHAQVPEGSAYHFFKNRQDIFKAVVKANDHTFIDAIGQPVEKGSICCRQDLSRLIIERCIDIYNSNHAYRQLMLSGKTPLEIKMADNESLEALCKAIEDLFQRYFHLPVLPNPMKIFRIFTDIVDAVYIPSVMAHNMITDEAREEAVRAGTAYLGVYFPPVMTSRD